MPKMVKIEANPDFKPNATQKAEYSAIEKAGAKTVTYQTAIHNIRHSGGMYRIQPEASATATAATVSAPKLAEMDLQDLKLMMVSLGVKTEKQMKKSEVIKVIETKLAEIDIVDDDETT
ncbi:hypothetical protein KM176_16485 [Pseudooceanicola sp. CBS1P-1]|uniref:Uncharacterized protein n=1 Tax=Pseudooceanicola albus TaxID=2692189 RepID=A0A6L7G4R7_9RHOB|nr:MULTISPECIES: hypothetical protein [Pseudooceanicola]MBT9385473.1 hypothetical protein [Pseudooceanicola endophyticus]MXN19115.1 hypothetical protein [Pseudooceanicola albus]